MEEILQSYLHDVDKKDESIVTFVAIIVASFAGVCFDTGRCYHPCFSSHLLVAHTKSFTRK